MADRPVNRDTRRFHRKSRNGCMQCKQRHVKCDECKPSCGNCSQTNRACSFLRMLPSIPTSLAANTSTLGGTTGSYNSSRHNSLSPAIYSKTSGPPTPASAVSSSASPSCTAAVVAAAVVATAEPISPPVDIDARLFSLYNSTSQTPEFNLADFSMLHNWSTVTSLTLSPTPEAQQVWARTVVQIALQHRFLLHGILAISALHLAYTHPSTTKEYRELVDYAAQNQTIALSLFQKALVSPTPGGQREALFVLSILISVIAIATLRDEISDAMEIDIITTRASGAAIMDFKWIHLSRGILVLNQDHLDELARGSLGMLVSSDVMQESGKWHEKYLATDLRHLPRLWHGDEPLTAIEGLEQEISKADREAFDEAYFALISTRSRVSEYLHSSPGSSSSAPHNQFFGGDTTTPSRPCVYNRVTAEVFIWLIRIPQEYIELLERQHPIALVILAHYASLLGKECATWWSEKSAYMIIRRVWVVLDERLRKWIESPMADVRRANG
uniref:Sterol uptake control protein 2 n=1 Tax=Talaromyces marneffei PM1 TaxID=1077442 RepID=A0A093VP63_TALMA